MRLTEVTTRVGDKGETALVGGSRVSKASPRVEAYGEVDELNSVIGLVRARLQDPELDEALALVQNDLFTVGADLASPPDIQVPRIEAKFVHALEEISGELTRELGPLTEFILPGGSEAGATLHLARTVARRAERRVVALAAIDQVNPEVIVYLNRLSDLLFNLARAANRRSNAPEKLADFSKRDRIHKPVTEGESGGAE
ncbi:MAG TPA: cob(I)yrinic acid a,c-diamide adenosyltransferase [Blastocatellia bacterium]|nr:cob(I)yrinic acid a,c-diamide adenosyltransferase [Blastocatellia bacterium]